MPLDSGIGGGGVFISGDKDPAVFFPGLGVSSSSSSAMVSGTGLLWCMAPAGMVAARVSGTGENSGSGGGGGGRESSMGGGGGGGGPEVTVGGSRGGGGWGSCVSPSA